ncbi:hypothetical protein [Nocardia fluminea]|uniref:hypothetical protein n=1 Tax=Nocardia fluminea TaxID=134984 RepID=UPI0033E03133
MSLQDRSQGLNEVQRPEALRGQHHKRFRHGPRNGLNEVRLLLADMATFDGLQVDMRLVTHAVAT